MAVASIVKILKDADRVYQSASRYLGQVLKGDLFEKFHSHMGVAVGAGPDQALESMRYLQGKELTKDLLINLCIRLIANQDTLRKKKAVPPWRGQPRDEWALAIITSAHTSFRGKGDKGGQLRLLIVSGSAAGTAVSTWWSWRFCIAASRKLGFPRRRGQQINPIHFRHPRDLVRLRLMVKLKGGVTDMPKFSEIKVKSSHHEFNLALLRKRFRITAKCPQGYADNFMCHNCPHSIEVCELGTHRLEFRQGLCSTCNQDGMFDPEFSGRICLDCLEKPSGKTTEEKPT